MPNQSHASIRSSRPLSFAVIVVIYILAALAGILTYRALSYPSWARLLLADIAATVVTFAFSVILDNASVYDPYWSVQPIVILTALAFGRELTPLNVLHLVVVWFWGCRLTANWAYTFGSLEHQDWRYTMLREKTGPWYPFVNFFGIHMVPTLIVFGCVYPAVFAQEHPVSGNAVSVLFCGISLGSAIMQGTADYQMHRFRRQGQKGFIRDGLWKWSRHPNYLGEILMWWGVDLSVVCAAEHSLWLCAGAAANTLLFFCASIPMAERRQANKPGFEQYKAETRMLLPIRKFKTSMELRES